MAYDALHNSCPTFQKGADATYEELKTQCSIFKNWIVTEEQMILRLNREISEHLNCIDMYESKLKQIKADIIRYEVENELKEDK